MGLEMVATSLPSSQTLAAYAVSSFKRRRSDCYLLYRCPWRSGCIGTGSRVRILPRPLSSSSDSFPDEDFSKQMHNLDARFGKHDGFPEDLSMDPFELPDFQAIAPASIERKANSIGIPMSLRIIKRKKQSLSEGLAGESTRCSVKKAFSSMVFIVRELHSHSLQMREALFSENLQGIVATVQTEIHAAFVWLFQKVFSQSPTLMVHVMILLANYSVYSMSCNAAVIADPRPSHALEEVSVVEDEQKLDASYLRKLNFSSSDGNTASVGGNNGSGGKYRPVANGTGGDGQFDESNYHGISREEEAAMWSEIVEEASRMEGDQLDHKMMEGLVSPVDAKIEDEDHSKNFRTVMQYQIALDQEPKNSLLLANFAQFLYLAMHDYDRAEEYFKKATAAEPKDAEAWSKYANFLWVVRNDEWGAEEAFLEALSVEPTNAYHAASYANFLWNTGGEDTCFPFDDLSTDG